MNSLKIFAAAFAVLAMFFAISNVYSIPIITGPIYNIDPCIMWGVNCSTPANPVINVELDEDKFYVEDSDDIDVKFIVENKGNVKGHVKIQIDQSDDDFEDYFEVNPTSEIIDIDVNDKETIRFEVDIDEMPDDDYELEFDVETYYYDSNNKLVEISKKTIEVELTIDDYEDFDVELDNETICYGADYPVKRHLIFDNESNDDYYIKPTVKSNDDLMPDVDSDKIKVEEDESVSVEITFRKQAPVGEYELEFDQKLYTSYNSDDYIRFKKTLTVFVENCEFTNNSFYLKQQTINMKNNETASVGFDFYNNTDNSMNVNFTAYADDQSIGIGIPNSYVTVGPNSRRQETLNILTSDSTTAGEKKVTVTATTPYTSYSKVLTVNVNKTNLYISATSVTIPVGLKGIQTVTIENNTNAKATIDFYIENTNSDLIIPTQKQLEINAGSKKSFDVEIYPKSIGNKSYKLITNIGGLKSEKTINYASDSEVIAPSFVSTYQNKLISVSGVTTSLPVVLENVYNFKTTVTLKVMGDASIVSKQTSVILNPREKKTVNVQFSVLSETQRTIRAFLAVNSDVSNTNYPLYLTVTPDTSFANALILVDAPTTIAFSGESSVKLKVNNPNGFVIKDANIVLLDSEDKTLGYAKFVILPNETREIEVKFKLDSQEDITGSVVLNTSDVPNIYYVVYINDAGYFNNGLFNLGIGGTISIVLGAIIIVLLILYFALRRPSVPVIQ